MQDTDTSVNENANSKIEGCMGASSLNETPQLEDSISRPVPENSSTLCIECKHVVPVGAKKCKECDSFQDWRRYLVLSGTALSLIIALLSVSGIVVPILIESMSEKKATLTSKVVSTGGGNVKALVANSGTIDGYLVAAFLQADGTEYGLDTVPFSTVNASSSLPIDVSLKEEQRRFVSAGKDCKVRVQLLDHALEDATETHDVACSAFR